MESPRRRPRRRAAGCSARRLLDRRLGGGAGRSRRRRAAAGCHGHTAARARRAAWRRARRSVRAARQAPPREPPRGRRGRECPPRPCHPAARRPRAAPRPRRSSALLGARLLLGAVGVGSSRAGPSPSGPASPRPGRPGADSRRRPASSPSRLGGRRRRSSRVPRARACPSDLNPRPPRARRGDRRRGRSGSVTDEVHDRVAIAGERRDRHPLVGAVVAVAERPELDRRNAGAQEATPRRTRRRGPRPPHLAVGVRSRRGQRACTYDRLRVHERRRAREGRDHPAPDSSPTSARIAVGSCSGR